MTQSSTVNDLRHDLRPDELRSEAAFMRRRVRALERAERALYEAANTLHAHGDRDMADMLFASWCDGDNALAEAREYLVEIDRTAARRPTGAEPARPAMQAAAA